LAEPRRAAAAIGIRLSSPAPVLYRARRVGRNGAGFTMYKLRTMHQREGAASAITGRNDPRVFPFGAWLRRTKIDELPQLFNVLRGDMSLVGPRPADPEIVLRHYAPVHRNSAAHCPSGWQAPAPSLLRCVANRLRPGSSRGPRRWMPDPMSGPDPVRPSRSPRDSSGGASGR